MGHTGCCLLAVTEILQWQQTACDLRGYTTSQDEEEDATGKAYPSF